METNFEKIIKQYINTKEFQSIEKLEDKIIYLRKVLFDPNFFSEIYNNDKILSEEVIDYLSKLEGVDNSQSKCESIFLDDNEKESESLSDKIKQMELVVENANKYSQKMVDEQVAILNRNRKEFSDIKKEDLELIEEQFTKETQFTELDLTEFQQEQRLKHIEYNELKVKVKKLSEKNKKLKAKNKKLTKKLRKITAITNTGE
jgi:hypothetical protein